MESVIPEDSPLAEYLEGTADSTGTSAPKTPESPIFFAPRGLPGRTRLAKLRESIPPLKFQSKKYPSPRPARSSRRYSRIIAEQFIGPSKDGILDQFRYLIITSQLLNSRPNPHGYIPGRGLQPIPCGLVTPEGASHTAAGLAGTGAIAYFVVWLIHQFRNLAFRHGQSWQTFFVLVISVAATITAALLLKRHWLAYLRKRVITLTSSYTTQAQACDAASSAGMQLVQEVELVSRGYRISAPMPPASRIEEQSQIKRCMRLRRTLSRNHTTLLQNYLESYRRVEDFVIQLDFERYCDVHEISRSDLDEINAWTHLDQGSNDESLKSLQITLQRLFLIRRIFLCALLALGAGKPSELSQWNTVLDVLRSLSALSHSSASTVDGILSEESISSTPEPPKDPLSPNHERVRAQVRRFTTMSQGIRELQAKVYLLRDESDRALNTTDDITELGPRLLEQYDNFGADLRSLMHEWEEGRRALAANITKHENRAPLSPGQLMSSRSTTPSSLGGRTAVGGSPADALKILNGEMPPPMHADSSDEELFEAVASPRTRSTLTREERIAKLKEDRIQQAIVREQADASRTMVKELESVIKLRSRPRGVRTSL